MGNSAIAVLTSPKGSLGLNIALWLLAAVFAYVLYRRALAVSRLDHALNDTEILARQYNMLPNDLEIRHRGEPVPQVSCTIAAIWNGGNQTVQGSQIVDTDRLRFETAVGVKILQAHVIAFTRDTLNVRATVAAERNLEISFDYLDKGDGLAVFIAHSGGAGQCVLRGTLRGVTVTLPRKRPGRMMKLLLPLAIQALALFLVVLATAVGISLSSGFSAVVILGTLVLTSFGDQLVLLQRIRTFPKALRSNPTLSGLLPHLLG